MPTLTVNLTVSYGTTVPNGAVPRREPFNFVLDYTEESSKTVHVPAGAVDFPVTLDTIGNPKFLFARAELSDVLVRLGDGTEEGIATTALAAELGWLMFVHPIGQPIKQLFLSAPASPLSGARVRIVAFE